MDIDASIQAGATTPLPRSMRADRFLARVRAHLAGLTHQQALRFLQAQRAGWERAYAKFVCEHEGDLDPPTPENDPPTASDYLLTITGLTALLAEHRQRRAAA